eukprot:NODE_1010_length_1157_cov_103.532491_g769_i0.p2 GENE.NODE_1010_length_1157_cov_103.532491_g769_i0~~NODE_1010_length_1157_cov_103.532491_g769_i0.p2  ORF type:complete len:76 (+),score=8.03 NODE_1010_length_1157_cov_103.532491_g769_i0:53-280(+)
MIDFREFTSTNVMAGRAMVDEVCSVAEVSEELTSSCSIPAGMNHVIAIIDGVVLGRCNHSHSSGCCQIIKYNFQS